MKKWFAVIAIFVSSYLVFLVATMPLALVLNTIKLPKNINIGSVSGSIWQGKITQVLINNYQIHHIKTQLNFWSLLRLSPRLDVNFGEALSAGAEGKFTLSVTTKQLLLNDVEIFVRANDIAKQVALTMPSLIPVTAQGNVELLIAQLSLDISEELQCEQAQGQVSWLGSGVVALENNIKLGNVNADLSCQQGDLIAKISPENNLGLHFTTRISLANRKVSGQGYLKPGTQFPAQLTSSLRFIGRPDNQGRYLLRF